MRQNRFGVALVAIALVVVACGGGSDVGAAPDGEVAAAESLPSVDQSTMPDEPGLKGDTAATTGASPAERPAPDPSREIAPDFSLNLGDGSTFVLSEETRPVFMVFWAEW